MLPGPPAIRACLRRERRGDPERLPSAWPTALRPWWKTLRKLVRMRLALRHPFTCCDGIRRRPRWWISASRYPARLERLSAPGLGAEEMLLTDFCNRHATRAPLGSFDPRGDRRAFAPLATSDGAEPQRTSRVTTCLTARPELQPPSFTRLLVTGLTAGVPRGCGCHSILPGSRSSRAREMAPPVLGVIFRGRAEHDGL
jgi:hypothetical protein